MSKILKIFIISCIIYLSYICVSFAETTNLYNDIANETTQTNSDMSDSADFEEFSEDESVEESTTGPSSSTLSLNSNARINTISSIPEANLGLNNILCIILIAIGILIILLAIAILIRLKN